MGRMFASYLTNTARSGTIEMIGFSPGTGQECVVVRFYLPSPESSVKGEIMPTGNDEETIQVIEVAELSPYIKRLQMSEIEEHPDNPRIHTVRQIYEIKQSLIEHGYIAGTMVVQESRMRLVKGHGVYKSLLELGCRFADFVVKDMSDKEALIYLMRDNRLSDLSSWHPTKFMQNVQALKAMKVSMGHISFSMKQIETMIPKDVDIDPGELDQDNIGTGKSFLVHICPKCGFKSAAEDKS